jgi:hypothetical protein
MALAVLPIEAALDAESHALAVSLLLLAAEALAGAAIFLIALRLISPRSSAELLWGARGLLARLRGLRSGAI